jgi:hypothetical protein
MAYFLKQQASLFTCEEEHIAAALSSLAPLFDPARSI